MHMLHLGKRGPCRRGSMTSARGQPEAVFSLSSCYRIPSATAKTLLLKEKWFCSAKTFLNMEVNVCLLFLLQRLREDLVNSICFNLAIG